MDKMLNHSAKGNSNERVIARKQESASERQRDVETCGEIDRVFGAKIDDQQHNKLQFHTCDWHKNDSRK